MKEFLISIFGNYVPVTYERFTNVIDSSTGEYETVLEEVIPEGLAGVDWPYVLSILIFIVTLYCVLRIIGAVINRV